MKPSFYTFYKAFILFVLCATHTLAQTTRIVSTSVELISEMTAASSGDRIQLNAGTFELSSSFTIKSGVKLIGTGANHTSVIKLLPGGQIVLAPNAELWNFKITRRLPLSAAGGLPTIAVATTTGGQNMRIEHCLFEKNRTAIYINPGGSNIQINRNKFVDNRTGILIPDGSGAAITNLQITGNDLSNNRTFGIIAANTSQFSIDATLTDNNIVGNLVSGINIDNSHAATSIKLRRNWFGQSSPKIKYSSLNISGYFDVKDHTEEYVNNPDIKYDINIGSNMPQHISGTNVNALKSVTNGTTPFEIDLSYALNANPSIPDFAPITVTGLDGSVFTTIKDAISSASDNATINLPNAIFNEDVVVSKAVTIKGTSQESTIIRGLYTGDANTIYLQKGARLENLTVTRDFGATAYEWTDNQKSQGITITGENVVIDNVKVTNNRNGIYINNQQSFTITNSTITQNRTGLQLAHNISNGVITNNFIENNLTHGLMLNFDLGPINATNLKVKHNSFSSNWYTALYSHGTNSGIFTNSDFTCNNFNTTSVAQSSSAAGEPAYNQQLPPHLGGNAPSTGAILRGSKIASLQHAPWLNPNDDANTSLAGYQLPIQYTVNPAAGSKSAFNNDFRILANALGCAVSGDQITLNGTFDFSEQNARNEWAKGIDGLSSTTGDNYAIHISQSLQDITLTASSLGAAQIQGPGDQSAANLESFLSFDGTTNHGWKISNLEISGFDSSIGYFNNAGIADNSEIFNNKITIPADLTDDANQNIGIYLTKGTNQKIYNNTFIIEGNGVSDPANSLKSTSIGIQTITTGQHHFDGLEIKGNQFVVTGQPHASTPSNIIGIWDNVHGIASQITITENRFTNQEVTNTADKNLQLAIRVTSRSSASKDVKLTYNHIEGFRSGIEWIGDSYGTLYPAINYDAGSLPTLVTNNSIDKVMYGIVPRKNASSTNTGAPAIVNNNSITNILTGGKAISYTNSGMLDASCNWFNIEPNETATFESVLEGHTTNLTYVPFLYSGDNDATIGFNPLGECFSPIKRLNPQAYFATIQQAIDDVSTLTGATITVTGSSFTLPSTITINKSITLQGISLNGAQPKLLGNSDDGAANSRILVSAPNVTIDNFNIESTDARNDWAGITTSSNGSFNGLAITNNTITNLSNSSREWKSYGLRIGSDNSNSQFNTVTISGNTITNFGRGARVTYVNGTLSQNTFEGIHALSIADYSVGGALTISNNNLYGSVNLIGSAGAPTTPLSVTDNIFDASQTDTNPFYLLQVRDNTNTTPVSISSNEFKNHANYGVFIGRSGNVTLDGNTFDPSGSTFTNIAWNSKTESSGSQTAIKNIGLTLTDNTLNGTGGTGIWFANHNGAANVVPLEDINIGTNGHPNTFASSLGNYIVLDNQSAQSNTIALWNTGAFASSVTSTMLPFNVDFFTPYNKFGSEEIANTVDFDQIALIETKFFDKDDEPVLGQIYVKAPVQNTNSGKFYLAIQPAIDEADNGNEILVQPVTFEQTTSILINKSIQLKGVLGSLNNSDIRPILTGEGSSNEKAKIFVKAPAAGSNVTIENFEIQVKQTGNDMIGILVNNTDGNSTIAIKNNIIKAMSTELYPVWSSFGIDIGTNNSGKISDVDIDGNTIGNPTGNGHFGRAIKVYRAGGSITKNESKGSYALNAIQFAIGKDLTVTGNYFFGSVSTISGAGDGSQKLSIEDNTFKPIQEKAHRTSFYGLQVRDNNKPVLIKDNNFNDYEFHSIFLGMASNTEILNNTFTPKNGSAANYTHIAWNSKSERADNAANILPSTFENLTIAGNIFEAIGTANGKAISFANHNGNTNTIPLRNITVGTSDNPNTFEQGFAHYIYLDNQTGADSKNAANNLWSGDAFESAKSTPMVPFSQHVYVGNNKFGSSESVLATTLDKTETNNLQALFHDFRDVNTLGHVFTRAVVLNDASNAQKSLHPTIQDAIKNAVDTDKIIAKGWEYVEDVQVNKSVSITGDNGDTNEDKPVISTAGGAARFLISAPNVTIDNFDIKVSAQGSDMHGIKTAANGTFNNLTIQNNTITNTNSSRIWGSFGLEIGTNTPNVPNTVTITNNNISQFGRAARLNFVNGTFTENTLEGTHALSTGGYAVGNNFLVKGNKFYGSVNMIGSSGATATLTMQENIFNANETDTNPFYLLQIRENGNNTPVNIVSNDFSNHAQYGVFIGRSGNVTLDGNTFNPTGNAFTNIAWNSKTESSSTSLAPTTSSGLTLINNTLNGTEGTGIWFANHNGAANVVPLENINIGTAGNENTFSSSLGNYIVLDDQQIVRANPTDPGAKDIFPWYDNAFKSTSPSDAYPFNVDFYAYHNKFGSNASPVALTLPYNDIEGIEGKVLDKDDYLALTIGQVYFRSPVHNQQLAKDYPTITKALEEANVGDRLILDEWTYKESVEITKDNISIERKTGADAANTLLTPLTPCATDGSSTGSDGLTISASGVTVKGFTIKQFKNGVLVAGDNITIDQMDITDNCYNGLNFKANSHNLTIRNSKINRNAFGVQINTTVSADNLTITDSEIKDNSKNGFTVELASTSTSTFNGARITRTDFSNNVEKGIYIEKANDLIFNQIIVNNCGTSTASNVVNQGIDINLKYGNYSGISILNSTITNSGQVAHANTDAAAAISIKARNDGSYASKPAKLTNVTISNNIINGPHNGLRIGEFGVTTNTDPTNVTVTENNFAGLYSGKALINTTSSVVNANCNWWGIASQTSIVAMTKGDVYITTFLGNGTNTAAGVGFTPSANCNAGRADYTVNVVFSARTFEEEETGKAVVQIINTNNFPQSGEIRFAILKLADSYDIDFSSEASSTIQFSGSVSVVYDLENTSVGTYQLEEDNDQIIITVKPNKAIPANGTVNFGFNLEAKKASASGNFSILISNASDDNRENNRGTYSLVTN